MLGDEYVLLKEEHVMIRIIEVYETRYHKCKKTCLGTCSIIARCKEMPQYILKSAMAANDVKTVKEELDSIE